MFAKIQTVVDRVRGRGLESSVNSQPKAGAGYNDSGMPIPQCEAEDLQMRFHLTPCLHGDIPNGLHNN